MIIMMMAATIFVQSQVNEPFHVFIKYANLNKIWTTAKKMAHLKFRNEMTFAIVEQQAIHPFPNTL